MTLLQANDNNNTIATNVATVAPNTFQIQADTTVIQALNGNDTITLTTAYRDITIQAGNGNDLTNLNSSLINSDVYGGNGNDTTTVTGAVTATFFQSLEGNNLWQFNANSNFNSVTAGVGNDTITVGTGITSTDDVITLGQGADNYVNTAGGAVTRLNLGAGQNNDTIQIGGAVSASEIRGAKDNDSIVISGTVTDSTLRGGDGNDTITTTGLVTNSLIIDTLGTANFVFGNASSQATITGGTASDTITATVTDVTDAFFASTTAVDVVSLATTADADASIAIGGLAQTGGVRTLQNNSTAGDGRTITLNASATTAGISIVGSRQIDSMVGGTGNDTLNGGLGGAADKFVGGSGVDTFIVNSSGTSTLEDVGLGGADIVQISNVSTANATVAQDWVATSATFNNNVATFTSGSSGIDINLSAATGANGYNINGSTGGEVLVGSSFADTLTGNAGADTVTGGTGADRFVFTTGITADSITDFSGASAQGDLGQVSIAAVNGTSGLLSGQATVIGGGTSVAVAAAGAVGAFLDITTNGATTALTTSNLLNITGTQFADVAAVEAFLAGTDGITTNATTGMTQWDSILLQYQGTDSKYRVGAVVFDLAVASNTDITAADISVVEIASFGTTALVANDLAYIA